MRAAKPLLSCFVLAFIVALLLDVAASAPAANVYWYKYNGSSNCWQTGYVGAESSGCDSVGPGFLATPGGNPGGLAHMANLSGFAGGEDTQLGTSGDYCNYYNTGDNIVDQETNDQAGYTGWEPPTPFGSYQESDAHGNTCQADGTTWGNEVRSTVSGGNCYSVCGMQHYVSLHQQGLNDRPWYGWFGEPSLVISTEAMLWAFEYSGEDVGDWGYTCPQIEDISTGNIIEYCLQEWRSPFNVDPIWDTEGAKECNSWAGHSYDQVQTYAYPGTDDASERSGSANTEVIKSKSGWKHFEIAISRSNLQNAINQINSTCGVSDSTNPQNWALIGIEQGLEGWRNFTVLGGASANLNLRTEYTTYTPYAPEPKTGKATEITGTSVTLNGAVVPYEPSYVWFQYGNAAFSGYEHFTPLTSVGLGTSEDPVSASTTNGIYPGTTYRFRTGASNPGGERFGPEEQFTTPATAPTLSTDAATQVKATSTQLNGEVWPNGLATTVHFEYGTTTAYGKATESFVIGAKGGEEHIN